MPRTGRLRRPTTFDGRRGSRRYQMLQPDRAASAHTVAVKRLTDWKPPAAGIGEAWQREAYGYSDVIGELGYVEHLTANTVASAKVIPSVWSEEDRAYKPTDDPRVMRVWRAFIGPRGGQAELIRRAALHMQIAGEALDLTTLVPTPTGKTTMGEIQPGDVVYGGDGQPCKVLAVTDVMTDRPCYEVTLTGGVKIVADAEHLWATTDRNGRARGAWRDQAKGLPRERHHAALGEEVVPSVVTTEQMRDTLKAGDAANHAIALTAINGNGEALPIDPYVLGFWLGDGTTTQGSITVHHADQPHIRERFEAAGYSWSPRPGDTRGFHIGILGLQADLRAAGLLGDKHIPDAYLRASEADRWALLQGLIDSDGHVDKTGRVEFSNTNQRLLWGVAELASTLGLRAGTPKRHRVHFASAGMPVAWLPRKAERIRARRRQDHWRYVESVEPVKSRPVRCIAVDSPDNTFLVTEHMVATHNCYLLGSPTKNERQQFAGLEWEFLSVEEIRVEGGGKVIKRNRGGKASDANFVEVHAYLTRMWNSDARFSERAYSQLKRNLPICREIVVLTQVVDAIAKSRLAAGILFVPDEMSFGPEDEKENPGDDTDDIDEFTEELLEHLQAPVDDRTSAAALVPLILRGAAELGKEIRLIEVARDLDRLYMELRQEAIGRLGGGLDIPPEVMSGKAGLNHWCVSEDTEVLTADRGWVTHEDLAAGDTVLTLNHETGMSEWQPVKTVARFEVEDLEMVSIEGDRHSSLTTPNHRWPTLHKTRQNVIDPETGRMTTRASGTERIWTTSEALNTNDSLVVGALSADRPTEAKWSDAFVEAVAWLWTEGHVREQVNGHQVGIWQSLSANPDKVLRIRRALTGVFGAALPSLNGRDGRGGPPVTAEPAWTERVRPDRPDMVEFWLNHPAAEVMLKVFADARRKVVDRSFVQDLTVAQLELFINASVAADGTVLPAGTMHLAQAEADRLEALELAAILSGRSTNVYPVANGMTMLSISAKTIFGLSRKTLTRENYTGTVWCPVTPNKSWVARRNGKVFHTGNTGYNIDADYIQKHVIPLGSGILDFITEAYLRPMLIEFEKMPAEEAGQFSLELDPSPIMKRADSGPAARAAYDRIELSGEAYRRENGFDEADAPSQEERTRRTMVDILMRRPLELAPYLLPKLFPEEDWTDLPIGLVPTGAVLDPAAAGGDRPDSRPDEVVRDLESGQDEPEPPEEAEGGEASLIDRLATAADAALERALEKAGNRVLSKLNGRDGELQDRLRAMDRLEVLSAVPSTVYDQLKETPAGLLAGAWESFADRAKPWIEKYLIDHGVAPFIAEEQAEIVTRELIELLEVHAMSSTRRPLRTGENGLRVPYELVERAMEATRSPRLLPV